MKQNCLRLLICLVWLALTAWPLTANSGEVSEAKTIGPQAVWTLPREALDACLGKNPSPGDCLSQVMKQTGASPQALDFNAMLSGEGYMRVFRPMGRVSLVTVEFPLRANTNEVAFLAGGNPALVSSELPDKDVDIRGDPAYSSLKKKYPKLEFWPTGAEFRGMNRLPNGSQGFEFAYPLLNGCHACELAGQAVVSLDFGPDGLYRGPRLIRLEPAQ
jgi:hypothetical protein